MDRRLVEELRERAQVLGQYVGNYRLGGNWNGFEKTDALWFKIHGPGKISFHTHSDGGVITFSDIYPKKVLKSNYERPQLSNTVIEDINASIITNQSSEEVERTYTYSEEETNSSSQEAGVEVAVGLRQLIGYGGAVSPVSGETEITVNINAHYAKTWGSESSVSKEVSNTVKVPAMTEVTISTQKSTSDFSQDMEHEIELDYKISLYKHGDKDGNGRSIVHIENIGELKDLLEGFGKFDHPLTKSFQEKPIAVNNKNLLLKPATVKIAQTLEFSNASTGKVAVTEVKL